MEWYRARDTSLGRDIAIKVLPEAFAHDGERLARFEREAKTLASLNHPNIAQIYGFERSDATPCIVMELLEGKTLRACVRRGPLPSGKAVEVAVVVAEALAAVHAKGITHRDLKPENIFLTMDHARLVRAHLGLSGSDGRGARAQPACPGTGAAAGGAASPCGLALVARAQIR